MHSNPFLYQQLATLGIVMKKLTDLTPRTYRCNFALSCPAVLKSDDGEYYIIGKTLNADAEGIPERVGTDETLVKISGELFEEVVERVLKKRGVLCSVENPVIARNEMK
jgi:hypothetical protein